MTYQEMVREIESLSLDEQLSLMEILLRCISRRTLAPSTSETSLERVRGMLKPDGPMPTDADLTDDYTDYLTRKYA